MTARIYSVFDAGALGPSLESPDGQVLTVNAINTTISRSARGKFGKSNGQWYFEVCFYPNNQIPGAPIALTGLGSVGIATSAAALNKYVGEDANAIGYKVGDGGVFTSAVAITGTTPATGTGSVTLDNTKVPSTQLLIWVGVSVDLGALTVTFSVNGSVYAVAPIPGGGQTWFPAITVAGPALSAYAINAFLNTGQRAFNNSQSAGWYSIASAQPLSLYLTTDYEGGYTSADSDSPQNQIYAPRVLNADALTIAHACTVWIWGQSGASASYGSLTIDNFDGVYDFLLSGDYRDTQVAFKQIPGGGTLAQAVTIATVLIDTVFAGGGTSVGSNSANPSNEQTITINFKSVMASLQKPLQRKLFPPFADSGVANSPLPITLGACRNITPLLRSTDTAVPGHQHYQIHDAQITAIATIRDKGTPLNPNASPPQYGPDNAPGQIYLAVPPVGALTCDASSMGGQVVIPGIADVLAGAGGFPTGSWGAVGSPPPGFTIDTLAGSSVQQMGGTYGGNANQMRMVLGTYVPWDVANAKYGFHVHSNTAYLLSGNTYIITVNIYNVQGQTVYADGRPTFGFVLSASTSASVVDATSQASITPYNQPINTADFATQTYSFVYTCPLGLARYLYIHICSGLGGSTGAFGTISNIVVQQVGAYNAQQQLPLVPISLSDYMREIAQRSGLSTAQISTTDTDAITTTMAAAGQARTPPLDWSRGYAIGEHFGAPVNCDIALQAPLDSLCGVAFPDANGVIRFRQLIDAVTALLSGATVAANFDLTNTQYGVACEVAYATGLTTQLGTRRNYKQLTNTDTVTDYVTLPGYLRTQFARLSQFISATRVTLANAFSASLSLAPLDSCLDDPTQGQYEIDRVCAPHGADRALPRFVTFTVCYDGTPPTNPATSLPIMFGDIVTVNYPRYGLGPVTLSNGTVLAGTPFVVKDTTIVPGLQTLTLTVWG